MNLYLLALIIGTACFATRMVTTATLTEPTRAWFTNRRITLTDTGKRIPLWLKFVTGVIACSFCAGFWVSIPVVAVFTATHNLPYDGQIDWWLAAPALSVATSYLVGIIATYETSVNDPAPVILIPATTN